MTKDIGICIRKTDYTDTSQILTFFCKDNGKISGIAKGAKRKKSKFGGAIDILSYGEIIFSDSGGNLKSLREFEPSPQFIGIRKSFTAMNCGLFAAELIKHFSEENDQPGNLFEVFCRLLENLQSKDNENSYLADLIKFQLSLLQQSGIGMILNRCGNCGKSEYLGPFISAEANGFVCNDCQMSFIDKVRLNKTAVNALAGNTEIENTDIQTLKFIEKALIHYLSRIMNKEPKMAGFFKK